MKVLSQTPSLVRYQAALRPGDDCSPGWNITRALALVQIFGSEFPEIQTPRASAVR
jgi:hypothetical protein